MSKLSLFPPRLDGNNIEVKRKEIKKYFNNSFDLFEKLFDILKDDEVFYKQSEPTRHPMIFYFGHTATFFINKLILMKIISQRINPEFESLFAIGVDEMTDPSFLSGPWVGITYIFAQLPIHLSVFLGARGSE